MGVCERVVVGIDGTDWGYEALRQTLVLAPGDGSEVQAVTALDTRAATWTGFDIARWQNLLEQEAEEARTGAEGDPRRPVGLVRAGRARRARRRPAPCTRSGRRHLAGARGKTQQPAARNRHGRHGYRAAPRRDLLGAPGPPGARRPPGVATPTGRCRRRRLAVRAHRPADRRRGRDSARGLRR